VSNYAERNAPHSRNLSMLPPGAHRGGASDRTPGCLTRCPRTSSPQPSGRARARSASSAIRRLGRNLDHGAQAWFRYRFHLQSLVWASAFGRRVPGDLVSAHGAHYRADRLPLRRTSRRRSPHRCRGGVAVVTCLLPNDPLSRALRAAAVRLNFPEPDALGRPAAGFPL